MQKENNKIFRSKEKIVNKVDEADYKNLLLEKALGFQTKDIVEEYSCIDGELVLQKKKVTIKEHPPDLDALDEIIKEQNKKEFENLTLSELEEKYKELCDKLKEELRNKKKRRCINGDKEAGEYC